MLSHSVRRNLPKLLAAPQSGLFLLRLVLGGSGGLPERTARLSTLAMSSETGRVAKIFGVENYAPSMGAVRSDGAISGPSNRFTDLVEGGEQASRRAVRR